MPSITKSDSVDIKGAVTMTKDRETGFSVLVGNENNEAKKEEEDKNMTLNRLRRGVHRRFHRCQI